MKQQILHFTLYLFLFVLTTQVQAQVVITEDFPRPGNYLDIRIVGDFTGTTPPSEGMNQTWDYTWLTNEGNAIFSYTAVMDNPDFPEAFSSASSNIGFSGLNATGNVYSVLDSEGWYEIGIDIQAATFPLGLLSGNNADTLYYIGGPSYYEGRYDFLQFPMSYGSTWTQTNKEITPMELSVAGFDLLKTSASLEKTNISTREVVGEGTIRIPKPDGTSSAPIEVLLLKAERMSIDSTFLAGAPAPAPLLNAFLITQGNTHEFLNYFFYSPLFPGPILHYSVSGGFINYNPAAADIVTAIQEAEKMGTNYFPNPIQAGQTLTIQAEQPIAEGYISLMDLSGREVYQKHFVSSTGYAIKMDIPTTFNQGMYIYHLLDKHKNAVGHGKLIVQ